MRSATGLAVLLACVAGAACTPEAPAQAGQSRPGLSDFDAADGSGPRPPPERTDAEGSDPALTPPDWKACALHTFEGFGHAECAHVAVPLDWSQPAGEAIDLFIKRIPAVEARRGQLWLLNGGPGGAGDDLEWLAQTLADLDPGLDVYMPDHRGTGRSARLGCPVQEGVASEASVVIANAEWPGCLAALQAQWGADLRHFTTTAAARDLGALVSATRAPGDQVLVYGVSYGTYLAARYLQLFPAQPDGVVLDSVCPSQGCYIASYDQQFNDTGHAFLDLCGQNATCRTRLGEQPWQRTGEVFAHLDAGHCAPLATAGLTRKRLRNILAVLVTMWDLRAYVPAVIHRIERCEPEDVAAIANLVDLFEAPQAGIPYAVPLHSVALGTHILLSEMYAAPPMPVVASLEAADAAAFVSMDAVAPMAKLYPTWPRYPADAWVGGWPETDAAILMLNGTLDPQTPLAFAQTAAAHLAGASQRLIVLPNASHGTIVESPTASSPLDCGLQLTVAFLAAPHGTLATDCLDDLKAPEFEGDAMLSLSLFGTSAMWAPAKASLAAARQARAVETQPMRRLHQRIRELRGRSGW